MVVLQLYFFRWWENVLIEVGLEDGVEIFCDFFLPFYLVCQWLFGVSPHLLLCMHTSHKFFMSSILIVNISLLKKIVILGAQAWGTWIRGWYVGRL